MNKTGAGITLEKVENLLDQIIEEFRDKECNCDADCIDGREVGYPCYFHRIETDVQEMFRKIKKEGAQMTPTQKRIAEIQERTERNAMTPRLDQIRARLKAAPKGPYEHDQYPHFGCIEGSLGTLDCTESISEMFINAPTDIAFLLAVATEALGALEEASEKLMDGQYHDAEHIIDEALIRITKLSEER